MEITGIKTADTLRKHIKAGKVPPPDVAITRKTRYWLRSTLERAGQDDIGGGCGQLWFVQDWMRKHPTLARPSIGRGIAVVHAPRVLREA